MMGVLCFYEVKGRSMQPFLRSGDYVLASRLYLSIARNDLIVVNHPLYGRIIKRISSIDQVLGVRLSGDNKESVTSDDMGWVDLKQVDAKVIFLIKDKG